MFIHAENTRNIHIQNTHTMRKKQKGMTENFHNPLRLSHTAGTHWLGLHHLPFSADGLCRFKSAAFCYRAAVIVLRRFVERHGANTAAEIINLWLPAHRGLRERYYLPCICGRSRIAPDEIIRPEGMQIPRLLAAMARQETGTEITPEAIMEIREKFGV